MRCDLGVSVLLFLSPSIANTAVGEDTTFGLLAANHVTQRT
jgi:hypothetical protein